jgi:hypothetical protein
MSNPTKQLVEYLSDANAPLRAHLESLGADGLERMCACALLSNSQKLTELVGANAARLLLTSATETLSRPKVTT